MLNPQIIAADALVAMDPAYPRILQNAGVVVDGPRITDVGELADLRRKYGLLPVHRHPGTLLPGLVNAHTHLELSLQSAVALQADHFTQWVNNLIAHSPTTPEQLDTIRVAFRAGITESLATGVTTLGDISRHVAITRAELLAMARESLVPRVVSYGEVIGLGKMRHRASDLIQAAATLPTPVNPSACHLVTGISPHAPYTVEGPVLRACVRQAILKRLPMAMHLAELAAETSFLFDSSGPLGQDWDLMQKMDIIDDRIPLMKGGPIRWAQRWGLLLADAQYSAPTRDFPVLLAHVNYCDQGELAQLAAARVSVAYCPRTHAYFRHSPHRYRDMLTAGINVCLATDSRASNPDLSVIREAQFLWNVDHTDPYTLLEMLTRRPAAALGLDSQIGTLSVGKFADLVLFPLSPSPHLIEQIVAQAPAPAALWINARQWP
jgi:aminodeoxyfutalosine deaminase